MNLVKCIDVFLHHCKIEKNLSDKSIKAYKIDLSGFKKFIIKDDIICINKDDLKMYLDYLFAKNYKIKTIKRKIVTIKALFNFAEFEDIIEVNPFRKIRINLKEDKKLPKVLSINEIQRLLSCINETQKKDKIFKRNLLIIELLLLTGIRVFELCEIKKESIDFDNKIIIIDGKGRKQRKVFISNNKTLGLLKEVIKIFDIQNGYIFLNRSFKPITDQTIRNVVKDSCKKCLNLDGITPHIFRHTFATILLNKGVDIRHIQILLGHNSIATTQIYTQMDESIFKEVSMKNPINNIII